MNNVVSFVEFLNERRNVERIVLQIAVEGDDRLAGRMMDAGLQRSGLAKIPPKADDLDPLIGGGNLLEPSSAAIRRAVIDEHNLPRPRQARQHGRELLVQGRNIFELVTNRHDYGDAHST